jgi:hypothetical protein
MKQHMFMLKGSPEALYENVICPMPNTIHADNEQKRKLAVTLFSNCVLRGRNLDLKLRSPYDLILDASKTGNWRPLVDMFMNHQIEFNITPDRIQRLYSTAKTAPIMVINQPRIEQRMVSS